MSAELVTLLGIALNFLLAYLVGKGAGPKIKKLIPLGNVSIGILTQIVAAMTQATANVATVGSDVVMAGFFGNFGKGLLDQVINGIILGLITTGAHSARKNVAQFGKA